MMRKDDAGPLLTPLRGAARPLAARPADAAGERAVVEAAVTAFATLERWLGEGGLLR